MWQTSSSSIGGNDRGINTSQLSQGAVYGFEAEYFDKDSKKYLRFNIKYYSESDHIEIIQKETNRLFLKKNKRPDTMSKKDLHVGGIVKIYGRNYEIQKCLDQFTESMCQATREEAFMVVPLDNNIANVFRVIDRHDMEIKRVNAFFQDDRKMVAISAIGPNSNNKLSDEGIKTRQDLDEKAKAAFFTDNSRFCGTLDKYTTCCIIQPSAVAEDKTAGILDIIFEQGYEISAMGMFALERSEAEEFLEVYKQVIPTYDKKVEELCSGPCIALEVRAENAVEVFRATAGPWDVDMAKQLSPGSIRGKYGTSNVKNAVHCTDLPRDAFDECNYFFGNGEQEAMLKPLSTAY